MGVIFKGSYMKQKKVVYPNNSSVVNIYIVYELDKIDNTKNTDFTIQNVLFRAMKITKDANYSHNKYTGYGICFNAKSGFSIGGIKNGKVIILFGVDMSFSSHERNRANNIYVMGKYFIQVFTTVGPTQIGGFKDKGTTISEEKLYKVRKKNMLRLHYNGDNSYLFVNGFQELKFKASVDQIQKNVLCVGNLKDDWAVTNSEKTRLYEKKL